MPFCGVAAAGLAICSDMEAVTVTSCLSSLSNFSAGASACTQLWFGGLQVQVAVKDFSNLKAVGSAV